MNPEDPLEKHFRLGKNQKSALKRLNIATVRDLLYHFPSRYIISSEIKYIKNLKEGDRALVYGTISGLKMKKSFRGRVPMAQGKLTDETGSIDLVWFNQPYIAKMVKNGQLVRVEGKVSSRKEKLSISNPEYEIISKLPRDIGGSLFSEDGDRKDKYFSIPVYPERKGITSKWIFHAVRKIIVSGTLNELIDPLPEYIRKQFSLPTLKSSLVWIHMPRSNADNNAARKRFAFEEIFFIQLYKQQLRKEYESKKSYRIKKSESDLVEFLERFPFTPTNAQTKAIEEIIEDMSSPHPMSRLLEGDVGSGKTLVAAATAYTTIRTKPKGRSHGSLQVAYMAPTEILAKQHFESFIEFFSPPAGGSPIEIGLITGSGCRKFPSKVSPEEATTISRSQLLKWVKEGKITILIGTHALIQKSVLFKNLAYVIIDEQHRFGIKQRKKLMGKVGLLPHLLSMTATPIPRTLALTLFGDLDLSLIDEMPHGRKPVETKIIAPTRRKVVYEQIRERLDKDKQAYVICPRIDEPDPDKERALDLRSVKAEAKRLKKEEFGNYTLDILHGKMKPRERDDVMEKFSKGEIDVLVATSVIEVGVNVVNATSIIIEGAERFGLAQLHQLRGRVARSTDQAYCYIFTDNASKKTKERLSALENSRNGFELAERDLAIRGTGELVGTRQSGITDIGMEALRNLKMVQAARDTAREIIENDPKLENFGELKGEMTIRIKHAHFE